MTRRPGPLLNVGMLILSLAGIALGQHSPSELIVLPANKSEADIVLLLPAEPAKGAKANVLPLVTGQGAVLSPQPVVKSAVLAGNTVTLHLADVLFWGQAKLQLQILPGGLYTYTLQRGPALAKPEIEVADKLPSELWLYNFDTQPLSFRWRIVSGMDSVCGVQSNGQPQGDCAPVNNWAQATIGPARSDPISFVAPGSWFDPWDLWTDQKRQAELEMRFGTGDAAPLLRVPVQLGLHTWARDHMRSLPLGLAIAPLWNLLWITTGAVLLMLAQVMIPNFRKVLRMEGQFEDLQGRLRALSTRVGGRLYTRCDQEMQSLRDRLAMGQGSRGTRFWDRIALSGNASEVDRTAGVVTRIESRLRLTERLDELQNASIEIDLPPSFCWNREKQVRGIQEILSRQFVSEAEEKTASAALDALDDPAASLKVFATDLEGRITALRRQFATEPWKSKCATFITGLPGCADLLKEPPDPVPDGGWTSAELAQRDLCAVRLTLIHRLIGLGSLVSDAMQSQVLKKLESSDAVTLASANSDLVKTSEGIDDQRIKDALLRGLWDVLCEPVTVTEQDVFRISFVFRNKDLNRCTAKQSFQCWWETRMEGTDPDYERGWDSQFIPRLGQVIVTAQMYDNEGNEIRLPAGDEAAHKDDVAAKEKVGGAVRVDPPPSNNWLTQLFRGLPGVTAQVTAAEETKDTDKRAVKFQVGARPSNTWHKRVFRGLIDAGITALVPVVTVALTQAQTGPLGVDKLVLLGFTSQAIRAAVVPESVRPTPAPPPDNPSA